MHQRQASQAVYKCQEAEQPEDSDSNQVLVGSAQEEQHSRELNQLKRGWLLLPAPALNNSEKIFTLMLTKLLN